MKSVPARAAGESGSASPAGSLRRIWLGSAVSFALFLSVGASVLWVDWQAQSQVRQRAGAEIINARAASIQLHLSSAIASTYALAAVLRQTGYRVNPADFESYAGELLRYVRGVSALQLAPEGVIRHIVPQASHEAAIGHDLLRHPDRNKEARLAVDTRELTLAGPFDLVQGGVGLAGRLPVFRPTADGGDTFWGFAIALIRVPDLLAAAEMTRLADLGYHYRLWRIQPDTGHPQVFAADTPLSSASAQLKEALTVGISVPNGQWFLSIEPIGGWGSPFSATFLLKGLLVVLVAFALTLTLFTLLRQPLVLGDLVSRRTRELADANTLLAGEIAVRQEAEAQLLLNAQVFEASGEAIMITDREDRVVSVNAAFTRITGYSRDDAVGRPAIVVDPGRQDPAVLQAIDDGLRRDGRWQGEFWTRRSTGESYPQWLGISVLTDAEGRVTHYVSIASDISERKASEERIHYLAHYDALTGLPNRVLLRDRVHQAMAHADRQRSRFSILLLDLDRFKVVNETLGHDLGDELLQRVVDRLREVVRESDTISRQGGDEFLIVAEDNAGDGAVLLAQKVLAALRRPFDVGGREVRVTASIGIAGYPEDGRDFEALLKSADVAMYFAKESGRATFRQYAGTMLEGDDERLALEAELARAVENGEFELHYQPQVDLQVGRVIGAEALVRWRHPRQGIIPPARFIALAEESGLIGSIGDWVLREACRQAVAWANAGLPAITVAVNISSMQFRSERFASEVAAILRETRLEPSRLELELTESILLHDVDHVLRTMRELKALGVTLAIDDFGTGYSSLAYLKRFSVDRLKIDRSFVRDLCTDPDDAAIVQAVIQLGTSLNLETIAEGAETGEQIDALRKRGCLQVQGFYFSRPLPAPDFGDYLAAFRYEAPA